jgi:hypothetical protein
VRTRELLRRLDASMQRVDQSLERVDESLAQNSVALARNSEALDRSERAFEDLRLFTRDQMRRMEVVTDRQVRALAALEHRLGQVHRTVDDHRDESRAIMQALLRLIDRLEGGGAAASA